MPKHLVGANIDFWLPKEGFAFSFATCSAVTIVPHLAGWALTSTFTNKANEAKSTIKDDNRRMAIRFGDSKTKVLTNISFLRQMR
ncbi:MAG: hypothetical protein BWY67_01844 [Bacteroidetes bacterium ADurb.Bin397]|nr:MAG: hypothetical protein BWY67_01844 [Bacteroidetes bacterium ADurb.Bin397]